ncbi:hypothetical protein [Streptomyces phytophilus]|uniref:hypothetical protein n=1 Tax=Streptomyces phytophilus TaxID=722715 RepID=UPI0015EFDFDE|nr:hypothetical protein [Streptomyces phytophilus]
MGAAVIAVIGTLAGGIAAGLMQHVSAVRREDAERAERRRQELAEAAVALIGRLVDHRRHQYLKIAARRDGIVDAPEAREARYEARSAVTQAMTTLRIVTDDRRLLALAEAAINATFALGDASEAELSDVRARSLAAHELLLNATAKAVA